MAVRALRLAVPEPQVVALSTKYVTRLLDALERNACGLEGD
jgi:hypothetical protein